MSESRLVVALVRGLHGLRGRVRVEVLTDRPDERFAVGRMLHVEGEDGHLTVTESSPVADGPGWWLRFREVPDRGAAERLRGAYLEADTAGDRLPEGEVYWHEVIGVPVVDQEGVSLGPVEGIYRVGVAEVLVVRVGGREVDIPNVASLVHVFAPRDGRIVVDRVALDLDAEPAARKPRGRRTRRAYAAGEDGAPVDPPAEPERGA